MIGDQHHLVRVAALLSVFVAVLTAAVLVGWTRWIDDAVLVWMEEAETAWLVSVSEVFDFTGSVPFVLFVIAGGTVLLAVYGSLRAGAFWFTMVVITVALSELTEDIIARPRPSSSLIIKSSFSYPSGHAMVSGAAIGLGLAAFASMIWPQRHRLFLAIGAFYAIATSIGRMYLRAHWLTDVVAGLAFGGAVLAVALSVWRRSPRIRGDVPLE